MAVALDANATTFTQVAATPMATGLTNANCTVGGGANRYLEVQVVFSVKAVTGVTVVWDSAGTPQSCFLISTNQTTGLTGRVDLWGLVAPTSGNKTAKVTWTGGGATSDVYMNVTAFTGVDQTGSTTTCPNAVTQNGNFGTVTMAITSAVGDWTFSHIVEDLGSISLPTPQTQAYIDNALSNGAGAGYLTGAASVTHGFTVGTSPSVYAWVGHSIKAAVSGSNLRPMSRPFPFKPGNPPSSASPYR